MEMYVEIRCIEIKCPHWGWVKVPYNDVKFFWWEHPYEMEMTFKCPACGREHKAVE